MPFIYNDDSWGLCRLLEVHFDQENSLKQSIVGDKLILPHCPICLTWLTHLVHSRAVRYFLNIVTAFINRAVETGNTTTT